MASNKNSLTSQANRTLFQVRDYIAENDLLKSGQKILAAVSGGADSVCLFLMLYALKDYFRVTVEIVTVNHGIRGESAAEDVRFVRALAKKYDTFLTEAAVDVPAYVKKTGMSEEEAARKLRYDCLYRAKEERGADLIAVGHHLEDNSETILHNLFRGSGLHGLGGMTPVSDDRKGIIRPLLCLTRNQIEDWLNAQGRTWQTDETNLENDYLRNRLRHQVIPLIEQEINKEAMRHVANAGMLIGEASEIIEELADAWIMENVKEEEDCFRLDCESLFLQKPLIRREIYLRLIGKISSFGYAKDVSFVHLSGIDEIAKGQVSKSIRIPGNVEAVREYKVLLIRKYHTADMPEKEGVFPLSSVLIKNLTRAPIRYPEIIVETYFPKWQFEACVYEGNRKKFPQNYYTKCFDYDTIKDGLVLRTRKTGDFISLENGGKKSLKSYMIDRKIPADRRDRIPLLADGSHILWIGDGRISAAYKVREQTTHILQLDITAPVGDKESEDERKS